MSSTRLEQLGLTVRETAAGIEAELELVGRPAINPLSRSFIDRVRLLLVDERLVPVHPPEMAGLTAVPLANIDSAAGLEELLLDAFNTHVMYLQRRSAELQALGLAPRVDPATLELSAELSSPPYTFVISADKQGHFRVMQALREGKALEIHQTPTFELTEFRERTALAGYLMALYGAPATQTPAESLIRFGEVADRFGGGARVPPRSALEILVEMRVSGVPYRFAAARLAGRSFRGLLAGPTGKLWAERFELEDFPGVAPLLARTLGVPVESIEVVSEEG